MSILVYVKWYPWTLNVMIQSLLRVFFFHYKSFKPESYIQKIFYFTLQPQVLPAIKTKWDNVCCFCVISQVYFALISHDNVLKPTILKLSMMFGNTDSKKPTCVTECLSESKPFLKNNDGIVGKRTKNTEWSNLKL